MVVWGNCSCRGQVIRPHHWEKSSHIININQQNISIRLGRETRAPTIPMMIFGRENRAPTIPMMYGLGSPALPPLKKFGNEIIMNTLFEMKTISFEYKNISN